MRLVLAAVWLGAGAGQLAQLEPAHTLGTVDPIQHALGALLPWFELALGALLLLGVGIRPTAALAVALEVLLVTGAAGSPLPGIDQPLDHTCLWDGTCLAITWGAAQATTENLVGGIGVALLSLWLVARPRCVLAMDNVLINTTGTDRRRRPAHALANARRAQSDPASRYESRR